MTSTLDILCYDDGCHLRRFARNAKRSQLTIAARKLASLNIVIDKMHFAGHIDAWCHANCNPYEVKELEKVCIILATFVCMLNMQISTYKVLFASPKLCDHPCIYVHTYVCVQRFNG